MDRGLKRKDFGGGYQQNYPHSTSKKVYFTPVHTIPPLTQSEFEGIVIDYLTCNPDMKIDSLTLLRNIQDCYRINDNSIYVFKTFSVNDIIRDLYNHELIEVKEINIGLKRAYLITKIDEQSLKKYKADNSESFSIKHNMDNYNETSKKIANNYICGNLQDQSKSDYLFHSMYSTNDINIPELAGINTYNYKSDQKLLGKKTENPFIADDSEEKYKNELMEMLQQDSLSEAQSKNVKDLEDKLNDLIYRPSAKALLKGDNYQEQADVLKQSLQTNNYGIDYSKAMEKIKKKYGSSVVRPFCQYGTRQECAKHTKSECKKVHFKPIIKPHTDVTQGDCSYLDTCRHMDICKFVHYQIEDNDLIPSNRKELILSGDTGNKILPSQWINCDIRNFDCSILGKFDVIMADPPWDIHMDLPYGTLRDDEMKNLPVKKLQDDGIIFLWVTGRATELARECLELWGYTRKEELVWIKTNQLQRLIRTGRTGHWLNHSKEHCLIGIKGNPKLNRNLDCDVLVSEVRETSRKPDEIYELIERMKPGGRKLELFARAHNRRQGWISLGNQLPGVYFVEKEIIERFNQTYPNDKLDQETMEKNKKMSTTVKEIENKDNDNDNNNINESQKETDKDLQEQELEDRNSLSAEEKEY
jgi:N6-adenosine-specific RNA methylase IME4